MFDTPVLLLVFNRLDTTARVLASIREIQPKQLFIAADGPRSTREGEQAKCMQVRSLVDASIDWPCEVHKLYRNENLGCGLAVSSAITWFFSMVNKGIILEDDTLPHATFFPYCEMLLNYYQDNKKVMHISGANLQCGIQRSNYSYYFSKYPLVWGWATWKDAWEKYQYTIFDSDDEIKAYLYENLVGEHADFFFDIIKRVKLGEIDTWDYQWLYAMVKNQGLGLVPNLNLIENIGFDKMATHTTEVPYWYEYLKKGSIVKILHDPILHANVKADKFYILLSMGKIKRFTLMCVKFIYSLKNIGKINSEINS